MEAVTMQSHLNEPAFHSLSPLATSRTGVASSRYFGHKHNTYAEGKSPASQGLTRRAKTRCATRPQQRKQSNSRSRRKLSVCEAIWLRNQVARALTLYFRLYYRAEALGIDKHLENTLIFIQDVTRCLDDLDHGSRQIIWNLFWEG